MFSFSFIIIIFHSNFPLSFPIRLIVLIVLSCFMLVPNLRYPFLYFPVHLTLLCLLLSGPIIIYSFLHSYSFNLLLSFYFISVPIRIFPVLFSSSFTFRSRPLNKHSIPTPILSYQFNFKFKYFAILT